MFPLCTVVERGGSAVEAIETAGFRIHLAALSKSGHFSPLHDAPVHSAV